MPGFREGQEQSSPAPGRGTGRKSPLLSCTYDIFLTMVFFRRGNILGWQGLVAVDGVVYTWMGGAPGPSHVKQVSLEYTSTKSIFTFDVAGKVLMTATFLSPVYPDDMSRQSQQFSYIIAKAKSSDGSPHDVQIYMDVSGGTLILHSPS